MRWRPVIGTPDGFVDGAPVARIIAGEGLGGFLRAEIREIPFDGWYSEFHARAEVVGCIGGDRGRFRFTVSFDSRSYGDVRGRDVVLDLARAAVTGMQEMIELYDTLAEERAEDAAAWWPPVALLTGPVDPAWRAA